MTDRGPEPAHDHNPAAGSDGDALELLSDLVDRLEHLRQTDLPADSQSQKAWLLHFRQHLDDLDALTGRLRDLLEPARTLRENRLLREIGRRLGQDLSTEGLALLIMDTLGGVIDFDAAGIYFLDPRDATIRWESLRGYDTDKLHLVRKKLDRGIMGWILKHGETVVVKDVRNEPRYFNARDRTLSELVVPILHQGRMIGFFNLESDRPGTYGDSERLLMEVLASQVAQTVEHTLLRADREERRRVLADLKVARSIQQSLLPKERLRFHDVEVAGLNLPSAEVGGDYFDHFMITPQDMGLVIADVAGKGIAASLLMATVRTGIRILAAHRLDMTGILTHLNEHLLEMTAADCFVTACYGVYHRPSRRLTYVNAGHNPPLLRRLGGAIESLDTGGLILGSFRGVRYEMGLVDLQPGDRLLFYTDGLSEALDSAGSEFGAEGVGECLAESGRMDAQGIIQHQLAALRRHTGANERVTHFQDDLTMMALVCGGEEDGMNDHKRVALYPGTFDPMTLGHLDIVARARRTFDEVVVLLAVNAGKTPLFPVEQRLELVRACVAGMDGVRVDCHEGLLADYAQRSGAAAIVRGLRAISDFDYEFQMAIVNRKLAPGVETVFLMPSEDWSYLSSSIVRELWRFKGDYSRFVPEAVRAAMDQLQRTA